MLLSRAFEGVGDQDASYVLFLARALRPLEVYVISLNFESNCMSIESLKHEFSLLRHRLLNKYTDGQLTENEKKEERGQS